MKPARFDYVRPDDLPAALALLREAGDDARPVAGCQSLGPMLNLRLAQPALLVDIRALGELRQVDVNGDAARIGACIRHAEIEDAVVADVTGGLLPAVAADIAYRAVRNAGTLGGSLAHADPSADWVTVMLVLGAGVIIASGTGEREVPADEFFLGPFATALQPGELVAAVRVPRLSAAARWGYWKFCRKPGEFAEAIGAVVVDPELGLSRAVIGGLGGAPRVVGTAEDFPADAPESAWRAAASLAGCDDEYEIGVHATALRRAARSMRAAS
ncbi:MAG: FAD binding domain-containing protein [Betaproteobacteria bacterium]